MQVLYLRNLEKFGFCGERKTGEPGEKPSEPGENQQHNSKLNPHNLFYVHTAVSRKVVCNHTSYTSGRSVQSHAKKLRTVPRHVVVYLVCFSFDRSSRCFTAIEEKPMNTCTRGISFLRAEAL